MITPEIAAHYGRSLHTVTKLWARNADWPTPVGKRGRYNEYDAQAVDAFVRAHAVHDVPDLEPDRLYTAQQLADAIGITATTIRADLSLHRWPSPDDTTDGVNRWYGRTAQDALGRRRNYRDTHETTTAAPVHKITSMDPTWQPGDVVLDADGALRVRSDHPRWVWGYVHEGPVRHARGGADFPEGSLEEHEVPRPLILLVRDGEAIGGRLVDEQPREPHMLRMPTIGTRCSRLPDAESDDRHP